MNQFCETNFKDCSCQEAMILDHILAKFKDDKASSSCIEDFLCDNLFLKIKLKIKEFESNEFIYMRKDDSLTSLRLKKEPNSRIRFCYNIL